MRSARGLVVDDATGRLLIGSGDDVLVRAADGSAVSTIEGVDGVSALTTGLGSVWALAAGTSTVVRIDPATATITGTFPVTQASGLVGLAVADGSVWTTGTATGGAVTVLVEVVPNRGVGELGTRAHDLPAGTDRMLLEGSPVDPTVLVAGEITGDATAYVLDVGRNAPVVRASTTSTGPISDLAVSPDGQEVSIAGNGLSYAIDDLSEVTGSAPASRPYGVHEVDRFQVGDAEVVALGGYVLSGVWTVAAQVHVSEVGQAEPGVVVGSGAMGTTPFPFRVHDGMEPSPDRRQLYVVETPVATTADPDPDARLVIIDLVPQVGAVGRRVVGTVGGGSVRVHGPELASATATVGGQPTTRSNSTSTAAWFDVPALPEGEATLELTRLGLAVTAETPVVVRDLGPFRDSTHLTAGICGQLSGCGATEERADTVDAALAAGGSLGQLPVELLEGSGPLAERAPLIRLYQAMLLRPPDTAGLQFWVDKVATGRSLTWVASAMAASSEFRTRYGTLSDAAFVDRIYLNVLGRPADAGGKAHWVDSLRRGRPRGKVVLFFAQSAEYQRRTADQVAITHLHLQLLGRTPTRVELADALALADHDGLEAVAAGIILSDEYAARVGAAG